MTTLKAKKGFTLAEVLVTLVVIGVVAALTIPALLQTTQSSELKTALKKSIATLNQAIVMGVAQDSVDASSCNDCASNATGLAQFFIGKLNVLTSNLTAATPYFYTADGMRFTMEKVNTTCSNSLTADPVAANSCVMVVDVNGDKAPNSYSTGNTTASFAYRDQYRLIVIASSVIPTSNSTNTIATAALTQ